MALGDLIRTALRAAGETAPATERRIRAALDAIPPPLGVTMPEGFDDSREMGHLVALLTAAERGKLGLGPPRERVRAPGSASARATGPTRKVRFHVILCSNDDGSGEHATITAVADLYDQLLPEVNAIYSGTGLQFVFDRRRDIEVVKSSLLNQDFVPPSGLNLNAPPDDPPLTPEEIAALRKPHEDARDEFAKRYRGRLVHFCVDGTSLWYRDQAGKPKQWVITPRYGGYSSSTQQYIHVPSWVPSDVVGHANFIAHEMGHFLHLPHTFRDVVDDVSMKLTAAEKAGLTKDQQLAEMHERQAAAIKSYIAAGNPPEKGLNVFDGDGLEGTPPDDGGGAIEVLNGGNSCGPIGSVEIHVEGQSEPFILAPDRANVMSYFKHCTNFQQHMSGDQGDIARGAVETKNRRHLLVPLRGAPAVTSRQAGVVDLFGVGQNRALWHRGISPMSSSAWKDLGGSFAGDPAAVSWDTGRIDVFAVGENDRMFHKAWSDSAWYPSATGWEDLGGKFHKVLNSPPAVASWGPDRLDVFGVGMDGGVWHRAWTGSGWYPKNEWESLGGRFCSSVAATSWGPNRLDLFGIGMDGGMWHRAWTPAGWYPQKEWQPLGGKFVGRPAVCSWGKGRLDVFAVGADGAMQHRAWTGSAWSPANGWESLGGVFSSSPAACSWSANRLDVFGLGMNGSMFHRAWGSGGWEPTWRLLGGVFTSNPAAFAFTDPDPDVLQVVGLGQDGAVYRKGGFPDEWAPGGTGWTREGGVFV